MRQGTWISLISLTGVDVVVVVDVMLQSESDDHPVQWVSWFGELCKVTFPTVLQSKQHAPGVAPLLGVTWFAVAAVLARKG
ncbi:hypothetical protein EDC01DRAFT_652684 [Geopyxis carbonaria]|nr:hypothetical protein EDC01DRAFT_652684 [Geopyxis carbonaria]